MSILTVYFTCPIYCIITLLLVRFELNFVEYFLILDFAIYHKRHPHSNPTSKLRHFTGLKVHRILL